MDLTVQPRQKFGKAVKTLRKEGFIPAELYGHGTENAHLSVPAREFNKVLKEAGTTTIINLLIDGNLSAGSRQERHPAIIHDIARNYLTDDVEHIDFYQVRMDEKIKTKVPIEFVGVAPAVKDKGGILNKNVFEIDVEALPADLPHHLEANLSDLAELNQNVYVKDIKIPKGVEVLIDLDTAVATVTEPRVEEVVEAVTAPSVEDVKVETEEKKAEREAEKAVGKEEGGGETKTK